MALVFRDFVPLQRSSRRRSVAADGRYVTSYITESMASLLQRAADFVALNAIRPINIETLVLPGADAAAMAEFAAPAVRAGGGGGGGG